MSLYPDAQKVMEALYDFNYAYDDLMHTLRRIYVRCADPNWTNEERLGQIERMCVSALTQHGDTIEALDAVRTKADAYPLDSL